jgi:LuxR family maltose regulon positive regulatory protein
MLRAELRRTEPATDTRLHGRASDWHAARGEVDQAMHHAAAAGDPVRAAALLAANAPEYVTHDRNGRMENWLSSFTEEQIAEQPALALAAANSHLLKGELYAVEGWESAARRVLHEKPPTERRPALEASVAILHAATAREGLVRMGEEAARGYALEPEDSPWRPLCCLLEGVSRHLTGDGEGADARLLEGVRRGAVAAPNVQTLCLAQLALAAAGRNDWESAAEFASRARAQVEHYGLGDYPTSAVVFAVSAAVRARRGRVEDAQTDMRAAQSLLDRLTDFIPWYEAETRLALAAAALRLSDIARARELIASAERTARGMPEAVALEAWRATLAEAAISGPELLTTAELRILGFLPTHLSFREIAGRLFVSGNTVKTQAHAVYRKLDAASRSEAVTRATQLGLLDF